MNEQGKPHKDPGVGFLVPILQKARRRYEQLSHWFTKEAAESASKPRAMIGTEVLHGPLVGTDLEGHCSCESREVALGFCP